MAKSKSGQREARRADDAPVVPEPAAAEDPAPDASDAPVSRAELDALRAQISASRNAPAVSADQVKALLAELADKEDQGLKKKRRPSPPLPGKWDEPIDVLTIEYTTETRERERERAWESLDWDGGQAVLRNPLCGMSVAFREYEEFPARNMRCPCNRRNHMMIRYRHQR